MAINANEDLKLKAQQFFSMYNKDNFSWELYLSDEENIQLLNNLFNHHETFQDILYLFDNYKKIHNDKVNDTLQNILNANEEKIKQYRIALTSNLITNDFYRNNFNPHHFDLGKFNGTDELDLKLPSGLENLEAIIQNPKTAAIGLAIIDEIKKTQHITKPSTEDALLEEMLSKHQKVLELDHRAQQLAQVLANRETTTQNDEFWKNFLSDNNRKDNLDILNQLILDPRTAHIGLRTLEDYFTTGYKLFSNEISQEISKVLSDNENEIIYYYMLQFLKLSTYTGYKSPEQFQNDSDHLSAMLSNLNVIFILLQRGYDPLFLNLITDVSNYLEPNVLQSLIDPITERPLIELAAYFPGQDFTLLKRMLNKGFNPDHDTSRLIQIIDNQFDQANILNNLNRFIGGNTKDLYDYLKGFVESSPIGLASLTVQQILATGKYWNNPIISHEDIEAIHLLLTPTQRQLEIYAYLLHPILNDNVLTTTDPDTQENISLPTKELSRVKYAGGGEFGYVFSCRYDGNDQRIIQNLCTTLKDENGAAILDNNNLEQHWMVIKLPKPTGSEFKAMEIFKEEADLVSSIRAKMPTGAMQHSEFNISQGGKLTNKKAGLDVELDAIVGKFENYKVEIAGDGSITPLACDLSSFLEKKIEEHPLLNRAMNMVGLMNSAENSRYTFNQMDFIHLDVAPRNFLLSNPVYKDGVPVAFDAKLSDFGFTKELHGQKYIVEGREVLPLRSISSERLLGVFNLREAHAGIEADLYSARITFLESIAKTLGIGYEEIISGTPGTETDHIQTAFYVQQVGNQAALTGFWNALELKILNLKTKVPTENQTPYNDILLVLESFKEYLTTPATDDHSSTVKDLSLDEDHALYLNGLKLYFKNVLQKELQQNITEHNAPHFIIHINQLIHYPLDQISDPALTPILSLCKEIAEYPTNQQGVNALLASGKIVKLQDLFQSPAANDQFYAQLDKHIDAFSGTFKEAEDKIGLLLQIPKLSNADLNNLNETFSTHFLLSELNEIKKIFSGLPHTDPRYQEYDNKLTHLENAILNNDRLNELNNIRLNIIKDQTLKITTDINNQLARYQTLIERANNKKMTPQDFADALFILDSVHELTRQFSALHPAQEDKTVAINEGLQTYYNEIISGQALQTGSTLEKLATNKRRFYTSKDEHSIAFIWNETKTPRDATFASVKTNCAVAFVEALDEALTQLPPMSKITELLKEARVNVDHANVDTLTLLKNHVMLLQQKHTEALKDYPTANLRDLLLLARAKGVSSSYPSEIDANAKFLLTIDASKLETLIIRYNHQKRQSAFLHQPADTVEHITERTTTSNHIQQSENDFHGKIKEMLTQFQDKAPHLDNKDQPLLNFFLEPYRVIAAKNIILEDRQKVRAIAEYFSDQEIKQAFYHCMKYHDVFEQFITNHKILHSIFAKLPNPKEHLKEIEQDVARLKALTPITQILEADKSLKAFQQTKPYPAVKANSETLFKMLAESIREQQNDKLATIYRNNEDKLSTLFKDNPSLTIEMDNLLSEIRDYGLKQNQTRAGSTRAGLSIAILEKIYKADTQETLLACISELKHEKDINVHINPLANLARTPTTLVTLLDTAEKMIRDAALNQIKEASEEAKNVEEGPVIQHEPKFESQGLAQAFSKLIQQLETTQKELEQLLTKQEKAWQAYVEARALRESTDGNRLKLE